VGDVPESTLTVAVEVVDPPVGGVAGFEENETWTPLGNADVLNVTGLLNDPTDAIVTVFIAELPPPMVIA
jgi:hypothetical protein